MAQRFFGGQCFFRYRIVSNYKLHILYALDKLIYFVYYKFIEILLLARDRFQINLNIVITFWGWS